MLRPRAPTWYLLEDDPALPTYNALLAQCLTYDAAATACTQEIDTLAVQFLIAGETGHQLIRRDAA